MSWWKRKRGPQGTVGLAWTGEELAVLHVRAEGDRPVLTASALLTPDADALGRWIREQGLAGARCVMVPPPAACVLRVLEAPKVPAEERVESVRWLVQDLVEFDIEDAWIDVLDIPVEESWTRTHKVYVVAGRAAPLAECLALARAAGLAPAGFELRERALLRLADPLATGGGTAVLDLQPKAGLLVVGERGELHLTRPLSLEEGQAFPLDALGPLDSEGPVAPPPAFESLLLELQRSLDYFETEFGRSPVRKIAIGPSDEELTGLAAYLRESLRIEIEWLDLAEIFDGSVAGSPQEQTAYLAAAGAALSPSALFAHELAPKRHRSFTVDAPLVLRLSALVAGLALAQFGLEWGQARSLEGTLAVLEETHRVARNRFLALTSEMPSDGPTPQQQSRLAELEAKRLARARLLAELASHDDGSRRSFAGIATGLARTPVPGVWLTEIHLSDAGRKLELHGHARDPARLPALLAQMEPQPELAGAVFQTLSLERAEDGSGFRFALQAAPPGARP